MNIAQKLQLLRTEMQKNSIDFYLVPSIDAHNSEYLPACWQRRDWISGFTGSAGTAIITLDHAYLWTDGRYFLQANQELDSVCYTLMKQNGFVPEIEAWILQNGQNKTLGVDPKVLSIDRAHVLKNAMKQVSGAIKFIPDNLIDTCKNISGEDVTLPAGKIYKQIETYSGKSTAEKLAIIEATLHNNNAEYFILNALDEIAWVLNIRGNDVAYNPLAISYLAVGKNHAKFFIDSNKVPKVLQIEFKSLNIEICEYNAVGSFLSQIANQKVLLDSKVCNYWIYDALDKAQINFTTSPIVHAKACKNITEQNGTRTAHIKDAVAVINYLTWLNHAWQNGIDEISAEEKLHEFRSEQPNFVQESFSTISGFASNGAIIHYRAHEHTKKIIDDSSIYLVDSGGQYLEGTTDITRTVHLGTPSAIQKRHYTLVLKGHLALRRIKFPYGTNGEHLDTLARQFLWSEYLDYRHGTGHGVGSFLCVHEGPQKISKALSATALEAGMIVSNEPGFYLDGEYGIRIENLCLINQDNDGKTSTFGPFLELEDLTLVPYCKKLLDFNLLDNIEVQQIKEYYSKIIQKVAPLLAPEAKAWLDNEVML